MYGVRCSAYIVIVLASVAILLNARQFDEVYGMWHMRLGMWQDRTWVHAHSHIYAYLKQVCTHSSASTNVVSSLAIHVCNFEKKIMAGEFSDSLWPYTCCSGICCNIVLFNVFVCPNDLHMCVWHKSSGNVCKCKRNCRNACGIYKYAFLCT